MAKLFVKVKSVFSRGPKNEEQSSPPASGTTSSSPSISRQQSETEAPAYHHAAAAQPPAYQQTLPSQPPPAPASRPSDAPRTTFQQQAREIAKIQVGGMRRTVGGGGASSFTASYAPAQPTGPPAGTFKSTTGQAGSPPVTGEKSSFQGNSNGAAHGRPQETAEDDEDVWARLAM